MAIDQKQEAKPTDVVVYASSEHCWRCGNLLVELRPDYEGWHFYCRTCSHLTVADAHLIVPAEPTNGAIGSVVAIRVNLTIEPARRDR